MSGGHIGGKVCTDDIGARDPDRAVDRIVDPLAIRTKRLAKLGEGRGIGVGGVDLGPHLIDGSGCLRGGRCARRLRHRRLPRPGRIPLTRATSVDCEYPCEHHRSRARLRCGATVEWLSNQTAFYPGDEVLAATR